MPAVTTASFFGELRVEVLLPTGMVYPESDTAKPCRLRSHENNQFQTEYGQLCGIVTTLIQTLKNQETYAFEDEYRIPEAHKI